MQLSTLQWPGLWNLPMYIVDYETNRIYDKDHPLPPHKSHLDSAKNRCVRLSAVLDLFSQELREEAEWTLRQLHDSFDIGKPIHSTTATPKPTSETSQTERKITTYIPSVALMAFAVIWPYCQAFQVSYVISYYVSLRYSLLYGVLITNAGQKTAESLLFDLIFYLWGLLYPPLY